MAVEIEQVEHVLIENRFNRAPDSVPQTVGAAVVADKHLDTGGWRPRPTE